MTDTIFRGLSKPAQAWCQWVTENYELEPPHLKVLARAAEFWDRGETARAALAKHGLTFTDRFGCPKPRPEVAIARDAAVIFARLLRELRLDVAPDDPRPAQLPKGRHRA